MTKRLASTQAAASEFGRAVRRRAPNLRPQVPRTRRLPFARVGLAGLAVVRLGGAVSGRLNGPGLVRLRDAGMTTAEYAIGTLAACGFAALLVTILRGSLVQALLIAIIKRALAMGA